MTKLRAVALLSLLALLLTACGGDAPAPTAEASAPAEKEQKESAGTKGKSEKESARTSAGKRSSKKAGRTSGNGPATAEGGEDDASSSWYPGKGLYTYGQTGWEEFCDATSCEKQKLPPTQEVKTFYERASSNEVVVVTEAEASRSRFVRTTTRHTPKGAFVTKVFLKFDYEGVSFSNSYQPEPPVEIVRLPLQQGMKWSGEWKDDTSGDYTIEVGGKEAVSVGGRTVQAFPLHTVTNYRGEFDGSSTTTVWVDPATAAVVKTDGEINVKSFFGTYRSNFHARLRSAPGY